MPDDTDHTGGAGADLRHLCEEVRAALSPADRLGHDAVRHLQRLVARPIRVGLVGRVGTGKSTLVNAIVGRRVAATAAQECTRIVTTYSYGSPEGAALVTSAGRRCPVPLSLIDDPDALADAIAAATPPDEPPARIEVELQSAPLRGITVVDTPGVEGTSRDAGPTVREVLRDVDILVLLIRGTIRQDDSDLVHEFQMASGGVAPFAEHTLALLSHADNFGQGSLGVQDPIDAARMAAADLMDRLPGRFARVSAAAPLLAQAARTGALTESDVRVIRSLGDLDPALLPFLGTTDLPGVDLDTVRRLLATVGPYGVHQGIPHAGSAAAFYEWLDRRSGVGEFMADLARGVLPLVGHARTHHCLAVLGSTLSMPGREGALAVVERAGYDAAFHGAREFTAYRSLVRDLPRHPLRAQLELMLRADGAAGRAAALSHLTGQPATAESALLRARHYQGVSSTARRGAEAEAARALAQSFTYLARSLGAAP